MAAEAGQLVNFVVTRGPRLLRLRPDHRSWRSPRRLDSRPDEAHSSAGPVTAAALLSPAYPTATRTPAAPQLQLRTDTPPPSAHPAASRMPGTGSTARPAGPASRCWHGTPPPVPRRTCPATPACGWPPASPG